MARTIRNTEFANINARNIKHKTNLVDIVRAIDEISEFDPSFVSNRLRNAKILTNLDDLEVSGYGENFH